MRNTLLTSITLLYVYLNASGTIKFAFSMQIDIHFLQPLQPNTATCDPGTMK